MNIGYACLTVDVPGTRLTTCALKNATAEVLREKTAQNLKALDAMLDYNIRSGIRLFRVSSDIVPFASHPAIAFDWEWEKLFADDIAALGRKAVAGHMRLSMHPGQYTVLNSPDPGVAERAVADLRYHCRFLDAMGLGASHKIILHIGGVYNDRRSAMDRFLRRYRDLDADIRRRLVIENDDRSYTVGDALSIADRAGVPVVFDNLHHELNNGGDATPAVQWIAECRKTWGEDDGVQKIHYSQQHDGKKRGSHSETIDVGPFLSFCRGLPDGIDVMLEVKDKNLSAVKCIAALANDAGRSFV